MIILLHEIRPPAGFPAAVQLDIAPHVTVRLRNHGDLLRAIVGLVDEDLQVFLILAEIALVPAHVIAIGEHDMVVAGIARQRFESQRHRLTLVDMRAQLLQAAAARALQSPPEELVVARTERIEVQLGPLIHVIAKRGHVAIVEILLQRRAVDRRVGLLRNRLVRLPVVERTVDHAGAQPTGRDVEHAGHGFEGIDEPVAVLRRIEGRHLRGG